MEDSEPVPLWLEVALSEPDAVRDAVGDRLAVCVVLDVSELLGLADWLFEPDGDGVTSCETVTDCVLEEVCELEGACETVTDGLRVKVCDTVWVPLADRVRLGVAVPDGLEVWLWVCS